MAYDALKYLNCVNRCNISYWLCCLLCNVLFMTGNLYL